MLINFYFVLLYSMYMYVHILNDYVVNKILFIIQAFHIRLLYVHNWLHVLRACI